MSTPQGTDTPGRSPEDPLIDEIRRIRRDVSESCGNDADRLCNELAQIKRQNAERVVHRDSPARPSARESR